MIKCKNENKNDRLFSEIQILTVGRCVNVICMGLLRHDKDCGVGDVAGYHYSTFDACDGAFFEKPTYNPKQHSRADEYAHIKHADVA